MALTLRTYSNFAILLLLLDSIFAEQLISKQFQGFEIVFSLVIVTKIANVLVSTVTKLYGPLCKIVYCSSSQ